MSKTYITPVEDRRATFRYYFSVGKQASSYSWRNRPGINSSCRLLKAIPLPPFTALEVHPHRRLNPLFSDTQKLFFRSPISDNSVGSSFKLTHWRMRDKYGTSEGVQL